MAVNFYIKLNLNRLECKLNCISTYRKFRTLIKIFEDYKLYNTSNKNY